MTRPEHFAAVLRPTSALWRAWGGKGALPEAPSCDGMEPPCRLWNWFARDFQLLGRRAVLMAESSTLLALIVPMLDMSATLLAAQEVLAGELQRLGVSREDAHAEARGLSNVVIARNNDRSTMGSLTNLALDLEWIADEDRSKRGAVDIAALQKLINSTPHVARGSGCFADLNVQALFGVDSKP